MLTFEPIIAIVARIAWSELTIMCPFYKSTSSQEEQMRRNVCRLYFAYISSQYTLVKMKPKFPSWVSINLNTKIKLVLFMFILLTLVIKQSEYEKIFNKTKHKDCSESSLVYKWGCKSTWKCFLNFFQKWQEYCNNYISCMEWGYFESVDNS